MDWSLAVLIAGTALYAGAVARVALRRDLGRRRADLVALGTAGAVAATFVLMVDLASAALPATVAVAAAFTGAAAYLVLRRDLGRWQAAAAAAETALVITVGFMYVVYLAVIAFIGAAGVYLLLRPRLRIGAALLLTGTTLSGLLAASVAVFWGALASM